ncbi:hypothetical protein JCM5350_002336 [Sporobolomyces pararoseus]
MTPLRPHSTPPGYQPHYRQSYVPQRTYPPFNPHPYAPLNAYALPTQIPYPTPLSAAPHLHARPTIDTPIRQLPPHLTTITETPNAPETPRAPSLPPLQPIVPVSTPLPTSLPPSSSLSPFGSPSVHSPAPAVPPRPPSVPAKAATAVSAPLSPSPLSASHTSKKRSTNWISEVQTILKVWNLDDGPTAENWVRWEAEILRQLPKHFGKLEVAILQGTVTRDNYLDEEAYIEARNNLRDFLAVVGGSAVQSLEGKEGDEIFPLLRDRLHKSTFTPQRTSDFTRLIQHRHDSRTPISEYFHFFTKKLGELNYKYRLDRQLQHQLVRDGRSPRSQFSLLDPKVDAFPEDVALDIFKSTLSPELLTLAAQSGLTFFRITDLVDYLSKIEGELSVVPGSVSALPASTSSTSSHSSSTSRPSAFPAVNRFPNRSQQYSTPTRTSSSGVQRPPRSRPPPPTPQPPVRTGPVRGHVPEYSSADQVPNYDNWKEGLFYSRGDVFKFRAGSRCFSCFAPDHYSEGCPYRNDSTAAGEAKAKVLKTFGIEVTPSTAKALVSFGVDEEEYRKQCGNEDSPWYNGGNVEARFIMADNGNLPPVEEFDFSSPETSTTLDNPPHLASPSVRVARQIPGLDLPDKPISSAKDLALHLIDRISPRPKTLHKPLIDRISFSSYERRRLQLKMNQLKKKILPRPLAERLSKRFARTVSSTLHKIFIWDTGASIHLTDRIELLHNLKMLPKSQQVRIGGAWGGSGMAIGKGTLKVDFTLADGRISSVDIHDVYYAPNIGHNLISGLQLMAQGFSTTNDRETVNLYAPDGDLVAHFKIDLALQSITIPARWIPAPSPSPVRELTVLPAVDLVTWHGRLGHVAEERMKLMLDENVATGLDLKHGSSLKPCEHCTIGKLERVPVPSKATRRGETVGDRLHVDVWGRAPEIGKRNGEEYVFGCIDDFSRYLIVEGMRRRSEVPRLLVDTINRVEVQRGVKVKVVRRDGAKENTSREVNEFFSSKGIIAEDTVPYAHNQNGVIERVWKTLIGSARTWLIRSGLTRSFWFLAVQAAAYVYNRLPHSSNDQRSPFSRYFGTVPDISHLRVFGCVAYVLIDEGLRDKLSPRTQRCVFVGYLENTKGWLFYNLASKKFITGVHVKFFEDHFYGDLEKPDWLEKEREAIASWDPFRDEAGTERGGAFEGGVSESEGTGLEISSPSSPSSSDFDSDSDSTLSSTDTGGDRATPPPSSDSSPDPPDIRLDDIISQTPPSTIPHSDLPGYRLLPPEEETTDYLADKWKTSSKSRLRPRPQSVAKALRSRPLPSPSALVHSVLSTAALDLSLQPFDGTVEEAAEVDDDGNFAHVRVADSSNPDAPSFKTAMSREDKAQWIAAVEAERAAMKERGVFDDELVELPRGGKAIPLKWVLLVKRDEYGNVIKYKARLVARGDLQRPGIDFSEVFSSTIRFASILVLLALSVTNGWDILQFDVSTAFLHAKLDDKLELFVRQPPGFVDPNHPTKVHRLRKSLYGLRQAGRLWSEHFIGCLKDMGFEQSKADESLFVRWKDGKVAIIPIHVDDGLVAGTDDLKAIVEDLSSRLDNSVKEEPLGLFLGVKISRLDDGSITLDQAHYVDKLAERFHFDGESQRSYTTPFDRKTDISPRREDEERFEGPYREILGAVVYLSTCTRPDISYTVSIASRFASDPAPRHYNILKRLLRYLISTRSLGLRFSPNLPLSLSGFSDADHAADPDTRRSVTGWAFTIAGAAVSWQSKRQPTVALSSTEAETIALSSSVCEAIWLRSLLADLGFPISLPTTIRVDNSSCILLAHHPTNHHRTKHFAVHARFSREKLASGDVQLEWIPTDLLPADMLTKGLFGDKHRRFSEALGLSDVSRKGVCWRLVVDGSAIESDRWIEISDE